MKYCVRWIVSLFAAVVVLWSAPAHAQQAPTVLHIADGRTIYVFGLRRWTVSMIQDSLGKYSPGDSLQSHACAAVLRYKLHFADAAALTVNMGGRQPNVVFVSVREPQDSARVHYRSVAMETTRARAGWRAVSDVIDKDPGRFSTIARTFLTPPPASTPPLKTVQTVPYASASPFARRDSALTDRATRAEREADGPVDPAVHFLRRRTTERDYQEALDAVTHSPNIYDRAIATLILFNFPNREAARVALFNAIREPTGMVRGYALDVLIGLAVRAKTPWSLTSVSTGIRQVLDGTSLFQLPGMIELLNTIPGVGPAQAAPFLKGGGEMLLNYLASDQPVLTNPVHALLVTLRGDDLGMNVAVWRAWIAGL